MQDLTTVISLLHQGGIIAYPTEAVYGLGCDPLNEQAVRHLLSLKKRSLHQGLLLIAADWQQLADYVQPVAEALLAKAQATWPGPVTWLFPASPKTPPWIRGNHPTVAVRVTAHPIAAALCREFGRPLVSTSANRHGAQPARTVQEVHSLFPKGVLEVVEGPLGGLVNPTEIRDLQTGQVVRS